MMASRSTGMRAGMGWRRQWFLLLAVVAWMMLVNGVNGEGRRGRKVSHQDEDDDDTAHVCDGNKRRISRDKVNDDFCDCKDGSDEAHTSACSHMGPKLGRTFMCQNHGFQPLGIYPSRVHDGVCDCCDGSDEVEGQCPNRCKEMSLEYLEAVKEEYKVLMEGRALRDQAKEKAKEILLEWQKELEDTKAEAKRLQQLLLRLKVLKAKEEKVEAREKISWAREQERKALQEELDKEIQQAMGQGPPEVIFPPDSRSLSKVMGLKIITPAPDSQEMTIEEYLQEDDLIVSGKIVKPRLINDLKRKTLLAWYLDRGPDGVIQGTELILQVVGTAIFGPVRVVWFAVSRFHQYFWDGIRVMCECVGLEDRYDGAEKWVFDTWSQLYSLIEDSPVGDAMFRLKVVLQPLIWATTTMWGGCDAVIRFIYPEVITGFEWPQARLLREAVIASEEELRRMEGDIQSMEDRTKDLSDYLPPDHPYLTMEGRCIESSQKGFLYKVCPFSEVKQDYTTVGKWAGWRKRASPARSSSTWYFDEGSKCYNGPKRSAEVTLVCGVEEVLREVVEPSICVYDMVLETPLACDDALLQDVERKLQMASSFSSSPSIGIPASSSSSSGSREEL